MANLTEIYFLLFTDTLMNNFIFNSSDELAIHTMKIFGYYPGYYLILIASSGFLIASFINYYIGRVIFNVIAPSEPQQLLAMNKRMEKIRNIKYINIIFVFSIVPFWGKFIVLFAGLSSFKPFPAILISVLFKVLFYTYVVYN